MLGTDARLSLGGVHKVRIPCAVVSWRVEDIRTPFLVSAVLDAIYQLIAHRFIYPLELLFTATLLALVPYLILRGPVNRIAGRFIVPDSATEGADKNASQWSKITRPPLTTKGEVANSDASKQQDWTKPAAMAIPKGEFFKDKVEQGRYGPIFPKSPAWLYDHREDRAGTRGGYPRLWEDDRRNDRRCATLGAYITHFCCRSRSRGFVSCGANAGFVEPQRLLGILRLKTDRPGGIHGWRFQLRRQTKR
jgi:hypothetical protein